MALGSFIVFFPAVILFGIKGVLAICFTEAVTYRLYLRMLASRVRKVPFQDHIAVFGSFSIIAETAYVHWVVPPLTIQLALVVTGIAMLVVIGRRSISEISGAHQITVGRQV